MPLPMTPDRPLRTELRPATEADLGAMVWAYNEAMVADRIGGRTDPEVLGRLLLPSPSFDPLRDLQVAVVDGQVAAWAHCSMRRRDERSFSFRHFVVGRQVEARRWLIERLMDWSEARLREMDRERPDGTAGRLEAWAATTSCDWTDALTRRGYAPSMRLVSMVRRDLTDVGYCGLPRGLELRPVREEHMRDIWQALRRAMSEDRQFCQGNWTEVDFVRWKDSGEDRRRFWQVAWSGDVVAGAVLAGIEAGEARTDRLFVAREFRRCGLGRALMMTALKALHDAGAEAVSLDVDPDGAAGAYRLYVQLGFRTNAELALYTKSL